MSFFDMLKKKSTTQNTLQQTEHVFQDLCSVTGINEIWKIRDTNNLIISLYDYLSKKCEYGEKIEKLTPCEKVIYFCQAFEAEINNGGFSQFLYNSTGDFTMETINSLIDIGAKKTSELLKKAITIFPDKIVPKDRDERESILDEILNDENEDFLNQLDNSFYAYEDNLLDFNYNYIISNRNKFI